MKYIKYFLIGLGVIFIVLLGISAFLLYSPSDMTPQQFQDISDAELKLLCYESWPTEVCDLLPLASPEQLKEFVNAGVFDSAIINQAIIDQ